MLWILVLEKTLKNSLDCKEVKSVNPKINQSWIFTGRTDAEALKLWLPDIKSQFIWKDPNARKDRRQKDEMVRYHHWLNGHEFKQTPDECRMEKPGGLQSMGSQRVRHDLAFQQQQNRSRFSDIEHEIMVPVGRVDTL